MTEDLTRLWARIQEGLLELTDHASALQKMMDDNPIVALNPARKAMSEALDKRITAARKEIEELEKALTDADKEMLYAELEEIRRIRKEKAS